MCSASQATTLRWCLSLERRLLELGLALPLPQVVLGLVEGLRVGEARVNLRVTALQWTVLALRVAVLRVTVLRGTVMLLAVLSVVCLTEPPQTVRLPLRTRVRA